MQSYVFYLSLCFGLLSFWLSPKGYAQEKTATQIVWLDSAAHEEDLPALLKKMQRLERRDSALISFLQEQAYWTASIDSIGGGQSFVYLGPRFEITRIDYPATGPEEIEVTRTFTSGRGLSAKAQIEKKGMRYYQNHGYPFVRWSWYPAQVDAGEVVLKAVAERGPFVQYDSLIIAKPIISQGYLERLTGQFIGAPWHEQRFGRSARLLKNLPFAQLTTAPDVTFDGNGALLRYNLQARRVNRFEFFLGLLPNAGEQGGARVTGELHLELFNLAKAGRYLRIDWQRVKERSPRLDFAYEHPYLFKTPLVWTVEGSLLKEDTLFVNRRLNFSLRRETYTGLSIGLITDLRGSAILSAPSTIDEGREASTSAYGLGLSIAFQGLDNPVFPRKGLKAKASIGGGARRLVEMQGTTDTLQSNYGYAELSTDAVFNLPLGEVSGLMLRSALYRLEAGELFLNDLQRLGGLNSLRGFNQNEFFASRAAVASIEYRIFPEENSVLFVFADGGLLGYTLSNGESLRDRVLGIGLGMTLATDAGALSINWAVGSTLRQGFDLRQSKIHFGYTARF